MPFRRNSLRCVKFYLRRKPLLAINLVLAINCKLLDNFQNPYNSQNFYSTVITTCPLKLQNTETRMEKDIFEDKGYITYLVISNLIFWSAAIWLLVSCLLKAE